MSCRLELAVITTSPESKFYCRKCSQCQKEPLTKSKGATNYKERWKGASTKNWDQFMNLLNEHYPRKGETPMLPMDYDQKKDDG